MQCHDHICVDKKNEWHSEIVLLYDEFVDCPVLVAAIWKVAPNYDGHLLGSVGGGGGSRGEGSPYSLGFSDVASGWGGYTLYMGRGET